MALFLSNRDVEQLVSPIVAIEVMEDVYREMAAGTAVTRTRTQTHVPTGEEGLVCRFKTMDGAISKYKTIGLRILPDMVYWKRLPGGENLRQEYKPVRNGKYLAFDLIFDAETGDLLAVIQDAYLQRLRIAGTHGAAAKVLARQNSKSVGVLGSGWLANGILEGLAACFEVSRVDVFSPNPQHRADFAINNSKKLGITVTAVESPEDARKGQDIVVACTNSMEPIFYGEWLEPGMHLTSIITWETDDSCYTSSDITVLSLREGRANEGVNYAPRNIVQPLHFDVFGRDIAWDQYAELGEVLSGQAPGRTDPAQITFFSNNVGFGAQFGALGGKAYYLAREKGVGTEIDIGDWYEQVR